MTINIFRNNQTKLNLRESGDSPIVADEFECSFFSEIIKSDNTLHKYLKKQNEIFVVMYCTNPLEIIRAFEWGDLNYLEVIIGHKKVQNLL